MTREEAIQWLTDIKNITENWSQEVAVDMAIEALSREQEKYVDGFPSADTVSREDYEDIINDYRKQYENMNNEIADLEAKLSADEQIQGIVEKRVAELVHLNYELEQQLADVVRCKDCRHANECHKSVQYTRNEQNTVTIGYSPIEWCSRGERTTVEKLKTDRPQGEWEFVDNEIFAGEYFCSICGKRAEVDLYGEWILSNCCPSCGAIMENKE